MLTYYVSVRLHAAMWLGVVGSNVEATGVFGYTHAHALTALTYACSGLWFFWKSSTKENLESIWAHVLLCRWLPVSSARPGRRPGIFVIG
jgi:hypothetical protein